MSIELIIFDCDGVLIESEVLANQVGLSLLQEFGLFLTETQYMEIALGKRKDQFSQILQEQFHFHLPFDFWPRFNQKLKDKFHQELQPIKGVKETLAELKIKKCIASGSSLERLEHSLRLTGLWDNFPNAIFSASQVERGKPFPDLFLLVANQMKVDSTRCLVIEDSESGILAAQAAEMEVWGFLGGAHIQSYHAIKFKELGVTTTFYNMKELPSLLARRNSN